MELVGFSDTNKPGCPRTIPKLELKSIVILVELLNDIRDNLGDIPIKFISYTDSEVALCWILSQKPAENSS